MSIEERNRAEEIIRSTWKEVAVTYTLGWAGPPADVERMFPYITSSVAPIRREVSGWLPLFLFQTRESPPENMVVAVPFKHAQNAYNTRLLPTNELGPEEILLLGDFAQALWFLIDTGVLARPEEGNEFERALLKLTGPSLFARVG